VAGYTRVVERVPLSKLGLTSSAFEQKRVLDSESEYIGSNAKITSYKNDYVNNAELSLSCQMFSSPIGLTSKLKVGVTGLDPELSPNNNNIDSGTVTVKVTNMWVLNPDGSEYEDINWPKTDTHGKAQTEFRFYFNNSEEAKAKKWYGTLQLSSTSRYATTSSKSIYKITIPCKKP